MNFTITAYTPDKRTSLFVTAIIYVNKYFPKPIVQPFDNFTFIQIDSKNIYENLVLSLENYFTIGSRSNPYNQCNLVDA